MPGDNDHKARMRVTESYNGIATESYSVSSDHGFTMMTDLVKQGYKLTDEKVGQYYEYTR